MHATDPIADDELSGTFWSDDPEGFLRLLEAGMIVESSLEAETLVLHSHHAGASRTPIP
ncbi:MAG: hypothetical protein U1F61_24850 [Opitutaceae bacterium]